MALTLLCILGAIGSLCLFTRSVSFYLSFTNNMPTHDNYSLISAITYGILFLVLFGLVVV